MRTAVMLALVGLSVLGGLTSVAVIGKERRPITPGVAISVLVVQALSAWGAWYLWAT